VLGKLAAQFSQFGCDYDLAVRLPEMALVVAMVIGLSGVKSPQWDDLRYDRGSVYSRCLQLTKKGFSRLPLLVVVIEDN
jgi:hypothetical protein